MRKKILILGHNYATQFIDIYNQYTRLFDNEKYEVTVAFLSGTPCDETRKRMLAEKIEFINCPKKSLRYLKIRATLKLLKLCRREKYSLVICHRYKPTFIMLLVAQFCNIPALIFIMHELRTMQSRGRQFLISCLAKKNMLFAGVSNAVRDDMRNDLWSIPEERVVTLYNMIDSDLTEPAFLNRLDARSALGLAEDDFVFGHIARLAKNKDQQSLILAFAMIKQNCPKAKLIIIGDGHLEAHLKQQVHDGELTQDVIFAGFMAGGFQYMKGFDCFVLPSIQEAFGRELIEAKLAKIPIIATSVNGIPEVIANNGILVKPKDPDALSCAMEQIYHLSTDKRQNIAEQGYQHVRKNFSIPNFHENFWQMPLVQILRG